LISRYKRKSQYRELNGFSNPALFQIYGQFQLVSQKYKDSVSHRFGLGFRFGVNTKIIGITYNFKPILASSLSNSWSKMFDKSGLIGTPCGTPFLRLISFPLISPLVLVCDE
jgi:hypothetical protein